MAAAVGVDDRMLPVAERGARVAEHPVGQLGVRARSDRPGDRHPVVAVDHRRQVDLARGDAELRQVGHPQPVRPLGVEVPVDEVVRRLAADLALVRAVAAGPLEQGDEPVPRHEPHDALRGHSYAHAPQFQMDALVPVAPSAVLERLPHQPQEGRVPVRPVHRVQLMIVRAARQADPGEQPTHGDAVPGADRPDEDRLLPIGRVVRVCAPLFSHQFHRPLEDRQLDLRLPFLPADPLQLGAHTVALGNQPVQIRRVGIRRAIIPLPRLVWCHWIVLRYRLVQQLTLPGFSRPTPPRPPRPRPAAT